MRKSARRKQSRRVAISVVGASAFVLAQIPNAVAQQVGQPMLLGPYSVSPLPPGTFVKTPPVVSTTAQFVPVKPVVPAKPVVPPKPVVTANPVSAKPVAAPSPVITGSVTPLPPVPPALTPMERVVQLAGLPDDQYLVEVRKLQEADPNSAEALGQEAANLRPHLAPQIAFASPVEPATTGSAGGSSGMAMVGAGVGVAALVGGALALGGGGGGGGGGGTVVNFSTELPGPPAGVPADYEDAEYGVDDSKQMINASAAYARGGTGEGIRVGVIDMAVDLDHPQFVGRIGGCFNMANGNSSVGNSSACTDEGDHGTHVAGSIAADRDGNTMHGVAFDADIYSIRRLSSANTAVGDGEMFEQALEWAAINEVAVTNNSWGSTFIDLNSGDFIPHTQLGSYGFDIAEFVEDEYGRALDVIKAEHIIMVWATGNEDLSQTSVEAALPHYVSGIENLWVAVTAVDMNGTLADYANACGVSKAWCIAAPGGDNAANEIRSTLSGGGFGDMSGTSMAAPQVTGAIAILLQLFGPGTDSNLTAEQIVEVLLQTADSSFVGYDDDLYGHGILDLDAATTPTSYTAVFQMAAGSSQSLTGSRVALGGAFGNAVQASFDGKTVTLFDHLNRGMVVDLEAFAAKAEASFDMDRALTMFGSANAFKEIDVGPAMKLLMKSGDVSSEDGLVMGGEAQLKLTADIGMNSTLVAGYNVDASQMIGFYGRGEAAPEYLLDPAALSTPYLALAETAATTGISRPMAVGTINVTAFAGTSYEPEETELDVQLGEEDDKNWTYGVAAEWSVKPSDRFSFALRGGTMAETDQLLGSEMEGAFGLSSATTTAFAGASVKFDMTKNVSLIGSYDVGQSIVSANESVFSDFGNVMSDSFSLGLLGSNGLQSKDRYGLVVSQPMRVISSEAEMLLPQSRNSDGSLLYSNEDLDLAPTGREVRLQSFYAMPMLAGEISFGGLVQFQPGHDANADAEWATMTSFRTEF